MSNDRGTGKYGRGESNGGNDSVVGDGDGKAILLIRGRRRAFPAQPVRRTDHRGLQRRRRRVRRDVLGGLPVLCGLHDRGLCRGVERTDAGRYG